jgi:NADH-quinone oxidoreductase subunit M
MGVDVGGSEVAMTESHLLSLLIFLPLVGAVVIMLLPATQRDDAVASEREGGQAISSRLPWLVAVVIASLEVVLAVVVWSRFDGGRSGFQLREIAEWMPGFNISYDVGIDGLSLLLILLTVLLSLLCVIYSATEQRRTKEYMVFLLILETAMVGVFAALDLVLFYVFWELVLIPMYFLIGIWGHERRIYAAVKFFIFTFVGSVLMLVGIVYIIVSTNSASLVALTTPGTEAAKQLAGLPVRDLMFVYAAFALAFMIKVPMFPLHTWLPDAHVEAPTAGSVILAGVLLKMGVYGFLRICMPLFPVPMRESAPIFLTLAVIAVLYGAIVAAVQPDMKKLVAYTSVSHMGIVMLGVFSFTSIGVTGAILQSINHGVSTGMLFFLVGMLYDRRHTREIAAFGGIRRTVPLLSAVFLIAAFSSIALPLTNGFIGEFLVLQGTYLSHVSGPVYAAIGALGMIFSAVYMLWLFQRAFCGPITHDENRGMVDLRFREKLVLIPLIVLVFWFGCYVAPWVNMLGGGIGVGGAFAPRGQMPVTANRVVSTGQGG